MRYGFVPRLTSSKWPPLARVEEHRVFVFRSKRRTGKLETARIWRFFLAMIFVRKGDDDDFVDSSIALNSHRKQADAPCPDSRAAGTRPNL
jgi:hypothetical protein